MANTNSGGMTEFVLTNLFTKEVVRYSATDPQCAKMLASEDHGDDAEDWLTSEEINHLEDEKETIEITNRWLAFSTSYQPSHKSSRWGSRCIFFEFTNRKADEWDREIDPSVAYNAAAISEAEAGDGRLSPLFSNDQSYAIVLGLME